MNTESLLCDELWLSDPASTADCYSDKKPKQCNILESCECECDGTSFYKTKEECEEAAIICLDKELSYMPEPGYVEYLDKSNNLPHFRFRAIQWLIKVPIPYVLISYSLHLLFPTNRADIKKSVCVTCVLSPAVG